MELIKVVYFNLVSGVGGQVDFERGAAISKGGIPIIALPSINVKNGQSRIVSLLKPGSGVITSRYHIHWLVTEYGAVDLFGKSFTERARLIISVAHPSHRAELEREAFERFQIRAWRV